MSSIKTRMAPGKFSPKTIAAGLTPAFLAIAAVGVEWVASGVFDRLELATGLSGLLAAVGAAIGAWAASPGVVEGEVNGVPLKLRSVPQEDPSWLTETNEKVTAENEAKVEAHPTAESVEAEHDDERVRPEVHQVLQAGTPKDLDDGAGPDAEDQAVANAEKLRIKRGES